MQFNDLLLLDDDGVKFVLDSSALMFEEKRRQNSRGVILCTFGECWYEMTISDKDWKRYLSKHRAEKNNKIHITVDFKGHLPKIP